MPDRAALEALIPHRPPFLLLDEIVDLSPDAIRARVTLRPGEAPWNAVYPGHYPGNPVTPGVLLCEIVFQAGAALMAHRLKSPGGAVAGTPVITRVRDAKFRAMVKPGDVLDVEARLDESVSNAYYLTGSLKANGVPALRVEFTAALVNPGA